MLIFTICISKNTKKDLVNIYEVDPNKVTLVYLGIENFERYKFILIKINQKKNRIYFMLVQEEDTKISIILLKLFLYQKI